MFLAATFSPNAMNGTFNTQIPVGGRFIVYNESQIGLNIMFTNGDSAYVPAWSADIYTLPQASPLVNWEQNNTLNSGSPPLTMVNVVSYQPNEKITGFFPISLSRQQNIGNSIPVSTSSTSVVNDGNASATQVVEATVTGSPGSNVLIQNQGLVEVFQWIGGSLTQIFKIDPGAASVVKLGAVGLVSEVLGTTLFDHNPIVKNAVPLEWQDTNNNAQPVLQVNNFNQTQLFGVPNGDMFQMQKHDGTVQMAVDLVTGLYSMTGSTQTVSGDTSGTMSLLEIGGGLIKFAVLTQNGFRQAGGKNMITMKQKFNNFVWIFNGGCGGVELDNGGSRQVVNCVTWGSGGNVGTTNGQNFCPGSAAGFVNSGVDAIGAFGADAAGHSGITLIIGT